MCPLVIELMLRKGFEVVVCVTGQHRQMLDRVLSIFGIVPDYDFSVMQHGQTLLTLPQISLADEGAGVRKPDIVLVHGDTTTTFAAALAAFT